MLVVSSVLVHWLQEFRQASGRLTNCTDAKNQPDPSTSELYTFEMWISVSSVHYFSVYDSSVKEQIGSLSSARYIPLPVCVCVQVAPTEERMCWGRHMDQTLSVCCREGHGRRDSGPALSLSATMVGAATRYTHTHIIDSVHNML